jgi:hypothetical protein
MAIKRAVGRMDTEGADTTAGSVNAEVGFGGG